MPRCNYEAQNRWDQPDYPRFSPQASSSAATNTTTLAMSYAWVMALGVILVTRAGTFELNIRTWLGAFGAVVILTLGCSKSTPPPPMYDLDVDVASQRLSEAFVKHAKRDDSNLELAIASAAMVVDLEPTSAFDELDLTLFPQCEEGFADVFAQAGELMPFDTSTDSLADVPWEELAARWEAAFDTPAVRVAVKKAFGAELDAMKWTFITNRLQLAVRGYIDEKLRMIDEETEVAEVIRGRVGQSRDQQDFNLRYLAEANSPKRLASAVNRIASSPVVNAAARAAWLVVYRNEALQNRLVQGFCRWVLVASEYDASGAVAMALMRTKVVFREVKRTLNHLLSLDEVRDLFRQEVRSLVEDPDIVATAQTFLVEVGNDPQVQAAINDWLMLASPPPPPKPQPGADPWANASSTK